MTAGHLALAVSVFLACLVEGVEALTIVLAVGSTRSWRSALAGVALALVLLAVLGPALKAIPLNPLRAVIGGLLLIFGLGWLRKAILRAAGRKAHHDEDAVFLRESTAARAARPSRDTVDAYAFAVSAKGVFLEGLEVVFIVLTFGANQRDIPIAAIAAAIAVLTVIAAGVALRVPLSRVPENLLKLMVGVLLTSFGMFWAGEGVRARWPGGEASLFVIVPFVLVSALVIAELLRRPAVRMP